MSKLSTVLVIDTTHTNYSIAIIKSNAVLSEISIIDDEKPSEKIIELVDEALLQANIGLHNLDGIVVGIGPGNFTGIRVGISAAKGIAFALNIKCIGINRFHNLIIDESPTLGIIKIKEDLYYTQMFIKENPISDPIEQNLLKILNTQYSNNTIISGDHALRISQKLNLKCGKKTSISEASELGFLGIKHSDSKELLPSPFYVKGPDAKLPTEPAPKLL